MASAKISERAKEAANLSQTSGNGQMRQHAGEGQITGPPPDMDDAELRATAGKGTSTSANDNLVPMVYILHYTSPQVDERDPAYVQGARPGDILLRGAPEGMELVRSDEGILFQPCYFWNDVTEWVPRQTGGGGGKGFVGKHAFEFAKDVKGAKQGPKGKFHWVTADGTHDLEETRNFAGHVCFPNGARMPFLVALKGSGHQLGRAWMTKINSKTAADGVAYASFAAWYRLRTEPRSNEQGKWFMYTVADARWATREERAAGLRLHEQFVSGEKQAENPEEDPGSESVASQGAAESKVDASV